MTLTLSIGGRDFTSRLSTYNLEKEISYSRTVTTLDGKEHTSRKIETYVITFSLFPADEDTIEADYAVLNHNSFEVLFTNPYLGGDDCSVIMRVTSNLEAAFGLDSVTGKRIYKGMEITLRETAD